jgi:hypothetical protein
MSVFSMSFASGAFALDQQPPEIVAIQVKQIECDHHDLWSIDPSAHSAKRKNRWCHRPRLRRSRRGPAKADHVAKPLGMTAHFTVGPGCAAQAARLEFPAAVAAS